MFLLLVNNTYQFSRPNQKPDCHPQFLNLAWYAITKYSRSHCLWLISTLAMSSSSLSQIAVIGLKLVFLSPNLTSLYREVKRSLKNINLLKMFLCSLVGQTYWIKTRYPNVAKWSAQIWQLSLSTSSSILTHIAHPWRTRLNSSVIGSLYTVPLQRILPFC